MWQLSNLTPRLGRSGPSPNSRYRQPHLEELERRNMPAPLVTAPAAAVGQLFAPVVTAIPNAAPRVNLPAGTAANAAQALAFAGTGGIGFSGLPGSTGSSFNTAVTFNAATFAQPLGSGISSLGFPTASAGAVNIANLLFSGGAFAAPVGVPNPGRTGPVSPITPGAGASLAGEAPYLRQDIALSGGGNQPSEFHASRSDYRIDDSEPSDAPSGATKDTSDLWW